MAQEKISTKDILQVIAVGGIVAATAVIPALPMALAGAYKIFKSINKRDLGKVLKRLEKQEMINFYEEDGKIKIEITKKGNRRLLEYDFENIEIKAKIRDGKWRLIIFDIPEDKKSARDVFRRKLIQLGLIRLQDSVFASAFPCKKEVDFLCHFLGISDFVTLVSLDRIERGEQLIFKKYYDWGN
ncbi:CRISPR-associated endonuclease Cas2 [Candidatus Daviesbacteria bacterium]|nr:CRISPR-associated endonuclease Cas2 [Candidatus Daviesbacteria bacterium]